MADGVILSHAEGHARGIASNHGNPEHFWKGLGLNYTMDRFKKAVKSAMNGTTSIEPVTEDPWYRVRKTWADAATQKGAYHDLDKDKVCADANEGYLVFDESGKVLYSNSCATVPYKARVSINNLNIRTGPGTGCAVTGEKTGADNYCGSGSY